MNKKGSLALYISFLFLSVIIITIGALVGPLGSSFNTKMISAGEMIYNNSQDDINNIQDPTIRSSVQNSVDKATDAAVTNIEVGNSLYQYSWLFLLIIAVLVIFLTTRRQVEFGGGGLV